MDKIQIKACSLRLISTYLYRERRLCPFQKVCLLLQKYEKVLLQNKFMIYSEKGGLLFVFPVCSSWSLKQGDFCLHSTSEAHSHVFSLERRKNVHATPTFNNKSQKYQSYVREFNQLANSSLQKFIPVVTTISRHLKGKRYEKHFHHFSELVS